MANPTLAESIFLAALEIPEPTARSAYLEDACKGDSDLRHRVERLLLAQAQVGSFLEQPIIGNLADVASTDRTSSDSDGHVRATLDATQAEGAGRAAVEDQLDFLAPSQKPGSLGRLDHYEILEVVGKGGFGVVLKAFDEKLHRVVAIKALSPELAASGTARQRFIREARTAAAVTHEHVVTIHAVVEEHRPPYLVMQMIDGVTLQQKLDKAGTLGLREVLRIGLQMAEGLAAAHKQGLVHRDIKPANILLENGIERVKITDFGLARAVDDASVTQSGVVAGTPMYMSPEQAEGLPIDHRSDLFSLGTVLYAMCTGHPPFRASSTMAVLKRVTDASPRPIREINNEIPDWLCDIVAKLHAKKPEDRFQTAKEVAEELGQRLSDVQAGRAIEGRAEGRKAPGEAPATTPVTQGHGSSRRRRVIAGVLGTIAIVVAGVLATPFLYQYVANQSTLILSGTMDPNLDKILVEQNATTVAEVSMNSPMVHVPSGDYQVEVVCKAGYDLFKYRVGSTGSGATDWQIARGPSFPLRLARADHISVNLELAKVPADPSKGPIAEPAWVQLFNGKDLAGWKHAVWTKDGPQWKVEGGYLVADAGSTSLITEQSFADFHCRMEAKINAAGKGFLCIRHVFTEAPIGTPITTLEPEKTGSIYRAAKQGELLFAPDKTAEVKADAWVTVEIIARGKNLAVFVDGIQTCKQNVASMPDRGRLVLLQAAPKGVMTVRKIEIKELPPADPVLPPSSWLTLFDGKNLTGLSMTPADSWKIEKGMLTNVGRSSLWSFKQEYRDVHFRVELKADADAYGLLGVRRKAPACAGLTLGRMGGRKVGSLFQIDELIKTKMHANSDLEVNPDTWFVGEVIIRGNEMVVSIDGKETGRHTFSDLPEDGRVGVSMLSGVIHVRKIEIKELPPEEPGWVQLFDGKSTKGWTMTPPDSWSVEKGLLVNEGKTHIWFRMAEYRDVHFRVEYQADAGSSGLVGVRRKGTAAVAGVTLGDPGDNRKDGSLFQIDYTGKTKIHVLSSVAVKPNTWAVAEVIVRDNVMSVFIDGKETGRHAFNDLPDEGKVGLEVLKGTIRVRKVEIKELPTPNYALRFDGEDDHVTITSPMYDGTQAITLEAWVRVPKVPDRAMTIVGNAAGISLGFNTKGQWLAIVRDGPEKDNIAIRHLSSEKPVEPGRFTHVALVVDGKKASLYVDGRAEKSGAPLRGERVASDKLFFIGSRWSPKLESGYPLLGDISGLRISKVPRYDRDFTPEKTFKSDSDTLALYDFKQGYGDLLKESSGRERQGQITGAKWISLDDNRPPVGQWASYFNGKDLTGWRMLSPGKGDWQVRDGLLLGHSTEDGKYLFSNRLDWGSFHLKMEAKLKGAGEILYHIHHNDWRGGLRVIHYGGASGLSGSIRSSIDHNWHPSINKVAFAKDDWFTLEVISDGPRLITKANGVVTADFTLTQEQQKKWYKEGVICIGCGSKGEWTIRKIEIMELPPPPPRQFALRFSGEHQFVDVPTLKLDAKGPFTIEAEVTLDTLEKLGPGFIAGVRTQSGIAIEKDRWNFFGYAKPNKARSFVVPPFTQGKRVHLALVISGGKLRPYVNGKHPSADQALEELMPADDWFRIGGFPGLVHQVRVSSVARTEFTPGKRFDVDKDTLALYACDDGQEAKLTDSSGKGHHGNIIRAKWVNADGSPLAQAEPWVQLFNGYDLKGWGGDEKVWKVEDGVLINKFGEGYLSTERGKHANFHLRATVRVVPVAGKTGTAGVWVRSIRDNAGYKAHLSTGTGQAGTLMVRDNYKDEPTKLSKDGISLPGDPWFDLEIIANGPNLVVKINGFETANVKDERYREGRIRLERVPDCMIYFKKIEIKELPPTAAPAPGS